MHRAPETTLMRAESLLRSVLEPRIFDRRVPVTVSAFHTTGEPVAPTVGLSAEYKPFAIGQSWGVPWGTTWFRFDAEIPHEWRDQSVVLLVDLGGVGPFGYSAEGLA